MTEHGARNETGREKAQQQTRENFGLLCYGDRCSSTAPRLLRPASPSPSAPSLPAHRKASAILPDATRRATRGYDSKTAVVFMGVRNSSLASLSPSLGETHAHVSVSQHHRRIFTTATAVVVDKNAPRARQEALDQNHALVYQRRRSEMQQLGFWPWR